MDRREQSIEVRRADGEDLVLRGRWLAFALPSFPDDHVDLQPDAGRIAGEGLEVGRGFLPDSSRLRAGNGSPDRSATSVNESPLASRALRTAAMAFSRAPIAPIVEMRQASTFSRRISSSRPGLSAYSARMAAWRARASGIRFVARMASIRALCSGVKSDPRGLFSAPMCQSPSPYSGAS